MAFIPIREWSIPARNSITTIYYDEATLLLSRTTEALDPAYQYTPGPPTDGYAAGALLTSFCEATTLVSFYASDTLPYVTISRQDGAAACDGSTLLLVRATGIAPVAPATTGSAEVVALDGVPPYQVTVGPAAPVTANSDGFALVTGLAPGAYPVTLTDSALPPATRTGSVVVPATSVPGCTLPTALNYNPAATSNDGSCEFVAVDAQPADLVAAHLPIPVLLRAAPIDGQPAAVLLFVETAATLAGPWVAAGTKRVTADPATAQVAFNVSEEAKALLRIAPPVEAGPDPALSALVRLRYVVRDPVTDADRFAGTLEPFRVLNAAVAPPVNGVLATGPLWDTTATLATGVVSAAPAAPYAGCPGRTLVWLNRAGGWEQGVFTGRHQHGDDQADPIAYLDLAGADRYASKGTVRDTLQVYSEWLDFPTYQYLRGIRRAVQVYERTAPGQYVPVLVASGSFPEYREGKDKEFEVSFTISYPPVLIQTQ